MSIMGLTPVASFVLRSLRDHPELSLPEAIAQGPEADETIDAASVDDGLAELRTHGLAEEQPGGGWRLTDAGRDARG